MITFALCAALGWAVGLSFPKTSIPCAGAALAVAVFAAKPSLVNIDQPLRSREFAGIGTRRRRRDDDQALALQSWRRSVLACWCAAALPEDGECS